MYFSPVQHYSVPSLKLQLKLLIMRVHSIKNVIMNTHHRQLKIWKGKNYPQIQTANN
jgi:hypothetical protein